MSRKHFELVARNLRIANEATVTDSAKALIRCLADDFARDFAAENPRFDRQRFMAACGC